MWICDPDFVSLQPMETLHKQWSSVKTACDERFQNRHMLVRRTFEAPANATWTLTITADDYYKLYLNGQQIGVGPAQAYPDRTMTNRYTLDHLREGKNVLAVHVFYMGTLTRAWQSGDLRQGLWFTLADEQGNILLESDRGCRTICPQAWRERGLLGYQTQFIEDVFGAEIPEGWKNVDFDDTAWLAACEHPNDDHVLMPQPTPIVDFYDQSPILLEKRGAVWFADMGHEVVGTVKLTARAKQGGVIEFRLGEELNADGTARCPMRCNCDYHLWWHLSGREKDEVDFFDYCAFRYIEIVAPENAILPESLRVQVRHYPMDARAGQMTSDYPLLNGIWDICRRAVQMGSQETFQDCPSREKGQYLGDATVTAHAHLLLTGDARMYRKMLYDFAASTRICSGMMAVAPGNEMQEIADFSCQYPEQLDTYYRLTGDLNTVRDLMPIVDGIEDYFDRLRNADGLLESVTEKWNLVDWPANLRDDYDFKLEQPIGAGVHNVINAYYYGLKKNANKLREYLVLPLRGGLEELKTAFQHAFRKEDGLYRDAIGSQHTALHSVVIPMYYGLTDARDIAPSVGLIRKKGLCCGVYTAYFVLRALIQNGEYDLMRELLMNEGIHSWANMLHEGATTCWEAWGREQKWNTSLCHPWASSPLFILAEDIIGLRMVKAGFEEIALEPHMPESWGNISLTIGTPKGYLTVSRTDGVWQYAFA